MKVLITGALGFIGSHLADTLYEQLGVDVCGVDDKSGNVVNAIPGQCHIGDVRHIELYTDLKPDIVVHAASPVGAVAILDRQESIVAEIIETTQAVLRYCERRDIPLVNISTSEVYGFSGVYREQDACVVPHTLTHRIQYAAGKLAAEQLVRTSRVRNVSVRPFNVAGPRQARAKGFVVPTFCEQALAGEPLTIFGDGRQERAPTAVWDLCDFLTLAIVDLTRGVVHGEYVGSGQTFNVGNAANRTTVLDLAETILAASGSRSPLVFTDGKTVHGAAYEEAVGVVKVPDSTRAMACGWKPTVALDVMVHRTLAEVEHTMRLAA